MAGGSQIIINKNGITFITPAKFEAKAGQHKFVAGKKIGSDFPFLVALIDFQSDLCPIKQVYSEAVVYAPPVTASNQLRENITSTTSTSAVSTVKCSSHIPKKEAKNYKLKFPVVNSYPVDKNGVSNGQPIILWENIAPRKFDLLYDPYLNKIMAKVILEVKFCEAVEMINGVETPVMYDYAASKARRQKAIPRAYDANKLMAIKTKIENTLNKQIKYLTPVQCNQAGGCTCKIPIFLELEFVENGRSHQKINLFPKSIRPNTDNWAEERIDPNTNTIMSPDKENALAHEVGHYFNFLDEYYHSGGMVHKRYINPQTQMVDLTIPEPTDDWKRSSSDSLMGSGSSKQNPKIPKYYFNFIKEWFEKETRIKWNIVN